jgi:hypothetical protein
MSGTATPGDPFDSKLIIQQPEPKSEDILGLTRGSLAFARLDILRKKSNRPKK